MNSLSSGEECWTRWKNASIADWTQDSGIRSTLLVRGRWWGDKAKIHTLSEQCRKENSTDMVLFHSPHYVLAWPHTKRATVSNRRHFPSSFNGTPCCGPASAALATASDQKRAKLLRWLMMLERAANFSNTAVHFTLRLPGAFAVLHEWPHTFTSHNGSCYANHVSPTHRPHKTVGFQQRAGFAGFGVETVLWCLPLYLRSRGCPSSQPSASSEMPP